MSISSALRRAIAAKQASELQQVNGANAHAAVEPARAERFWGLPDVRNLAQGVGPAVVEPEPRESIHYRIISRTDATRGTKK